MMDLDMRALTEKEDKYTFSNSMQISMQCGLIGHLRADMDSDGNGFFSSWEDYRKELKTDEFKDEFDKVINSLREEGDILYNRKSLAKYCYSSPQAKMNNEQDYYGVRVDTEKYAYLCRLNPNKGEYNLYCYCYIKDWLDKHIRSAEKGIRFITPEYKEKFRISDGEKIRITFSDGEVKDRVCRYIDDSHVEVGDDLYHICEFAERMEQCGAIFIPLRSDLPEVCFSILPSTGDVIIIKHGESGYYRCEYSTEDKAFNREFANDRNANLGVSKAQVEAMLAGSMYGWDVSAADPKSYDVNGTLLRNTKDRGDAR
ncbi:MAG TPA: hypothetical protein OIM00_05355 [Oscillospiraceae bacterium]|nr:hypothetical protein [Oscillospiraceae bacterium]